MSACWICLEEVAPETRYHGECVQRLFGQPDIPRVDDGREALQRHGVEMVAIGRGSISGVQPKVLVRLTDDRTRLVVVGQGGRYILKPQTPSFAALPENEHVTMRLARVYGLEVPECGVLTIGDGSLAYVVKRFDRSDEDPPRKLRQEDLCALAQQPSDRKYDGSAELCVRLLRKFTSDPPVQVSRLFRQLLFAFWTGNGDLHLKNLSVTTGPAGRTSLTPAYDLVNTQLVIPEDTGMALTLNGKRHRLRRGDWLKLAAYCGVADGESEIDRFLAIDTASALIGRSLLPQSAQERYVEILRERAAALAS